MEKPSPALHRAYSPAPGASNANAHCQCRRRPSAGSSWTADPSARQSATNHGRAAALVRLRVVRVARTVDAAELQTEGKPRRGSGYREQDFRRGGIAVQDKPLELRSISQAQQSGVRSPPEARQPRPSAGLCLGLASIRFRSARACRASAAALISTATARRFAGGASRAGFSEAHDLFLAAPPQDTAATAAANALVSTVVLRLKQASSPQIAGPTYQPNGGGNRSLRKASRVQAERGAGSVGTFQ